MGGEPPMQLYKKALCAGDLLTTFKVFMTRPVLG